MKATTIKVDGDLLRELERTKPPSQSLSEYVRSLLHQAVVRRDMAEAADRYAAFLRDRRASLARRVDERRSRAPRQAEAPVKRGSAYWINLEPSSPPELGKVRPGIVVSNSIQNERLDSVVIVPLSSRAPEIWPLRFRVELPGMKASYAVIPGIRQVSKSRLEDFIAETVAEAMARIGNALAIYLGD